MHRGNGAVMSKNYSGAYGRKDENHPEIVEELKNIGASVLDISRLKNCFDILVGFRGEDYKMEIKNPERMTKAQKNDPTLALTEGEREFMESWRGSTYHVVTSKEQALEIIGAIES